MRRNFTNERDYLNTVEQDRCAPPCCLNPPRPKPPLKPDTGFDCTCRTENCKVKFSTDPFSDCIEIKCRKRPGNFILKQRVENRSRKGNNVPYV